MSMSLDLKLNDDIDKMIRKLEEAKRDPSLVNRIWSVRKVGQHAGDWYEYWDEKLMDWAND